MATVLELNTETYSLDIALWDNHYSFTQAISLVSVTQTVSLAHTQIFAVKDLNFVNNFKCKTLMIHASHLSS